MFSSISATSPVTYISVKDSTFFAIIYTDSVVFKTKIIDPSSLEVEYGKVGEQQLEISMDTFILGSLPHPQTVLVKKGDTLFSLDNDKKNAVFHIHLKDSLITRTSSYIEELKQFPPSEAVILSQPRSRFIDYKSFELELKAGKELHLLSKSYDFLYLSLLDSSNNQYFFEFDSELEDLYKGYSPGLKLSCTTVGFVSKILCVKDLFNSKVLLGQLFSCISDVQVQALQQIVYPIYIKENIAIVNIKNGDSCDLYQVRLHHGVIQVNWLGGVIE